MYSFCKFPLFQIKGAIIGLEDIEIISLLNHYKESKEL
jgi:hypothetical protein